MIKALVNKILPFSSVDGPGNRMAVFFQGCNFKCLYCHNPETINTCTDCGLCLDQCPAGALNTVNGKVVWDQNTCIGCDACLAACGSMSTPKAVSMSVGDIVESIRKVRQFISGITVSGGECTLQKDFLVELFEEVHGMGLTTFVDTNGSIDFSKEKRLTDATDKVMLDIKSFEETEHIMLTGMSNTMILKNAEYLAKLGKLYEIRTVIVPGLLDNQRNVRSISTLISKIDNEIRYKLIRFRPIGVLGEMKNVPMPSDELMSELKKMAEENGCNNVILL